MKAVWILLLVLLAGCSTLGEVATSPDTFAVCKTADVATTAIALNTGRFHEANPLLKPFIGPHNFFPLIAFSVLVWWVVEKANEPKLTVPANIVTCGVAVHNVFLL